MASEASARLDSEGNDSIGADLERAKSRHVWAPTSAVWLVSARIADGKGAWRKRQIEAYLIQDRRPSGERRRMVETLFFPLYMRNSIGVITYYKST